MEIQPLTIGNLIARIPIIQGGMGIGISGSSLAAAVANEGGIGIISGVQIGYREKDFYKKPHEANQRALRQEIRKAKSLSPKGIIGVNFMVAMKNYKEMVQVAIEENIDLIISGAGLPLDLPSFAAGSTTKLLPIVSSAKAANILIKRWLRQGKQPDALIVEGPLAGGHLGFKKEDLTKESSKLENIVIEIVALVKKLGKDIPVIAAGGINHGAQIAKLFQLGVSGVQLGSLFVPTYECDGSEAFKKTYLTAESQDIEIIHSPVGLPGRAIRNDFIDTIEQERVPVKKCFNCLENCNPKTTPYCISQALIDAALTGQGLIFAGQKACVHHDMRSVRQVIDQLMLELKEA